MFKKKVVMMMRRTLITTMLMFTMACMAQVSIHIDIKGDKTFDSVFVRSEAKLQTKKYLSAPYSPSVTLQFNIIE